MRAVAPPTPTIPETLVLILNDLDGKRYRHHIPTDPADCLKSCLPVARAVRWLELYLSELPGGLGVSVRHGPNVVVCRFFLDGDDLETARLALDALLDGGYFREEEEEEGGALL